MGPVHGTQQRDNSLGQSPLEDRQILFLSHCCNITSTRDDQIAFLTVSAWFLPRMCFGLCHCVAAVFWAGPGRVQASTLDRYSVFLAKPTMLAQPRASFDPVDCMPHAFAELYVWLRLQLYWCACSRRDTK